MAKAKSKKAKKAVKGKPAKPKAKAKLSAGKAKGAAKTKAKAKAKAKPKAKAKARTAKSTAPPQPNLTSALADLSGRAMIVQIVGDAEAFFFDFDRLGPERRAELIVHHLAAFDRRKRAEHKTDWAESFVPVALIGESMPPPVRTQFDLSAPHEGLLLVHRGTGAVLHASSKDDDQLAILAPDLETLAPRASYVGVELDPADQSYAYEVDRTDSRGFTLGQIELLMKMGGAQLTLV